MRSAVADRSREETRWPKTCHRAEEHSLLNIVTPRLHSWHKASGIVLGQAVFPSHASTTGASGAAAGSIWLRHILSAALQGHQRWTPVPSAPSQGAYSSLFCCTYTSFCYPCSGVT